ncbi:MAG: FAD-dependent oxidoreductase [Coriobacteriia bacterium]|nr:FAD-dependent oxidoreductase [Coriobacteriia bacterium]
MEIVDPRSCAARTAKKRVVIAGGGYAGMTLAVTLAHRAKPSDDLEIVLVEARPYQQALSELDLVAAGTPRPQFAELWHLDIFRGLPVRCVYERLECVHPDRASISVGPRDEAICEIPYWRMVVATGAIATTPPVPGLKEHAITMWSVSDAQKLQRSIEVQFKLAATLPDRADRERALSFTVVGGGATGIEVVGTIAAVLPRMIRRAGMDPAEMHLRLIEGRTDILFDLPAPQRVRARRRLAKMGVEVLLGEKLVKVEDGVATVESGREVPSPVLVWCGGAHADPDAVDWGLSVDNSGRLLCDETLKAEGHDDIYVVGDVAAFKDPKEGRVLPMLAQFAIREAECAADSILAEARGGAPSRFAPHMHGEFVSVGPGWGVGWMFKLNVSGRFAIIMKRITYIMYWLQVGSYRLAWRRTRQMMKLHRL